MNLQSKDEGESGSWWSSLNGHRYPIINSAALLAIGGIAVTTWADVRELKARSANSISESRVAVLEEQMKAVRFEMARYELENTRRDERSIQDRDRIWEVLEREHGSHRR